MFSTIGLINGQKIVMYILKHKHVSEKKNMGIVDNIFILKSLLTHVLNQNKKLYCACVDFTKAFDFVSQDILWYKLIRIWIRGKMLDIIKSMYKEVKSQVKHNNMSRVMRNQHFAYAKTKTQISFAVTAKLISAFVFAT